MTAEEILNENTRHTLHINEGSPLHEAVIKAMEEYASIKLKEVEKKLERYQAIAKMEDMEKTIFGKTLRKYSSLDMIRFCKSHNNGYDFKAYQTLLKLYNISYPEKSPQEKLENILKAISEEE